MAQAQKAKKDLHQNINSIHNSLRLVLGLAQTFSLLPVNGIFSQNASALNFRWISIKIFYTLFTLLYIVVIISIIFYHFIGNGYILHQIVEQVFYINAMFSLILFLKLAKAWPKLIRDWTNVDMAMERNYGYPDGMNFRLKLTTCALIFFATVEHSLALANNVFITFKRNNNTVEIISYYKTIYPQVFEHIELNYISAILIQGISIVSTFAWNYEDLFIIVISSAMAIRFKQITMRLKHCGHRTSINYWTEIREDYNRLCTMNKKLDEALSLIVLKSFATNLFFLLIQLYNSLRTMKSTIEKIYFVYSFGFLILRTIAVSLYAAWINDESKEPAHLLFSLPSECYNVEVKRFLCQLHGDSTALTGCKMFKVTRGLVLNVAGAIVTYELVLLQFATNTVDSSGY